MAVKKKIKKPLRRKRSAVRRVGWEETEITEALQGRGGEALPPRQPTAIGHEPDWKRDEQIVEGQRPIKHHARSRPMRKKI
jgi:hypothetical protein